MRQDMGYPIQVRITQCRPVYDSLGAHWMTRDSLSASADLDISPALILVENGLIRLCRVSPGPFLCLPVARLNTKKSPQRPVEPMILVIKKHEEVNGFSSFQ